MVKELKDVKIAVIGGSGLYHLEGLEVVEEIYPKTVSGYCQKEGIKKLTDSPFFFFLIALGLP